MTFPVTVDLPPGCGVLMAGEDDREGCSSGMGDTPLLDACVAPNDEDEAAGAAGAPGAAGLVGALTLMEGWLGAGALGGGGAPRFVSLRTCDDVLEAGSICTTVSGGAGAAPWLTQIHSWHIKSNKNEV